jgi:hypothetical protein
LSYWTTIAGRRGPHPERFGPVLNEMDATGNVDRAYRKVTSPKAPPGDRPAAAAKLALSARPEDLSQALLEKLGRKKCETLHKALGNLLAKKRAPAAGAKANDEPKAKPPKAE